MASLDEFGGVRSKCSSSSSDQTLEPDLVLATPSSTSASLRSFSAFGNGAESTAGFHGDRLRRLHKAFRLCGGPQGIDSTGDRSTNKPLPIEIGPSKSGDFKGCFWTPQITSMRLFIDTSNGAGPGGDLLDCRIRNQNCHHRSVFQNGLPKFLESLEMQIGSKYHPNTVRPTQGAATQIAIAITKARWPAAPKR